MARPTAAMVGAALRARREHAGITPADLGAITGLAATLIGRVEAGTVAAGGPTLAALCAALGTTPAAVIVEAAEHRAVREARQVAADGPLTLTDLRRYRDRLAAQAQRFDEALAVLG